MTRVKRIVSFAALLVLALTLAGCVSKLPFWPNLPGKDPAVSRNVADLARFPADNVRDTDLAPHVKGEILVGVDSEERARQIAEKLDATLVGYLEPIGLARIELRDKTRSLVDAMRSLRNEPGVSYAQPNYTSFALPVEPLRRLPVELSSFDEVLPAANGFTAASLPDLLEYGPRVTGAYEAWTEGITGKGIVIAVVDTGVDPNHPILSGKVLPGYNPERPDLGTNDQQGHGTHVAGIAAGKMLSVSLAGGAYQSLFSGIAPDALILPIRVFNDTTASQWAVAAGIVIAAEPSLVGLPSPRADVINLSLGGPLYALAVQDAVNFALERGVVVVAAMGNTSNQAVRYPAAFQGVIAVGATDAHDDKVDFSTTGSHISVAAPGQYIFSAYMQGRVAWMSGTSMAAPHVAGAVALLLEKYPGASPAQIKELLEQTADRKPGQNPREVGHGRINIARALGVEPRSASLGTIELFVHAGGYGVPYADVVLFRGNTAVRDARTGGFENPLWNDLPYSGLAWFRGLEPGDDYWLTVRVDGLVEEPIQVHGISVRANEVTSVRVDLSSYLLP